MSGNLAEKKRKFAEEDRYDRTSVIEACVANDLGPLVRDRFARGHGRETRRLATSGSNSFKAFNTRF